MHPPSSRVARELSSISSRRRESAPRVVWMWLERSVSSAEGVPRPVAPGAPGSGSCRPAGPPWPWNLAAWVGARRRRQCLGLVQAAHLGRVRLPHTTTRSAPLLSSCFTPTPKWLKSRPRRPAAMVKVRWRAAPHVRVATRGGVRRIGLPSHARGRAPEVNPRGCERGHGDRHWAGHRHGLMLLGRGRGPLSV